MVTDFGEEMHCQFLEILRLLMDSFTMSGAHVSYVFYHTKFIKSHIVFRNSNSPFSTYSFEFRLHILYSWSLNLTKIILHFPTICHLDLYTWSKVYWPFSHWLCNVNYKTLSFAIISCNLRGGGLWSFFCILCWNL